MRHPVEQNFFARLDRKSECTGYSRWQ